MAISLYTEDGPVREQRPRRVDYSKVKVDIVCNPRQAPSEEVCTDAIVRVLDDTTENVIHVFSDGSMHGPSVSYTDLKRGFAIKSMNHHDPEVEEESSCMQMWEAATQGTEVDQLVNFGFTQIMMHVNDADPDVVLSCWIGKNIQFLKDFLQNPADQRSEEQRIRILELIKLENIIDKNAGMFRLDKHEGMAMKMAGIFKPYWTARKNGTLWKMNGAEMQDLIEQMLHNIDRYVLLDECEVEKLDCTYRDAFHTNMQGVRMVNYNMGPYAKARLCSEKYRLIVGFEEVRPGIYRYVVSKSPMDLLPFRDARVDYDLPDLFKILNEREEEMDPEAQDAALSQKRRDGDEGFVWGGRRNTGGSPREHLSYIPPYMFLRALKHVQILDEPQRPQGWSS
jgi:hypothetical protein